MPNLTITDRISIHKRNCLAVLFGCLTCDAIGHIDTLQKRVDFLEGAVARLHTDHEHIYSSIECVLSDYEDVIDGDNADANLSELAYTYRALRGTEKPSSGSIPPYTPVDDSQAVVVPPVNGEGHG